MGVVGVRRDEVWGDLCMEKLDDLLYMNRVFLLLSEKLFLIKAVKGVVRLLYGGEM